MKRLWAGLSISWYLSPSLGVKSAGASGVELDVRQLLRAFGSRSRDFTGFGNGTKLRLEASRRQTSPVSFRRRLIGGALTRKTFGATARWRWRRWGLWFPVGPSSDSSQPGRSPAIAGRKSRRGSRRSSWPCRTPTEPMPFFELLNPAESRRVQIAAMEALGSRQPAGWTDALIARWNEFTPAVRQEALKIMLGNPDLWLAMLTAVRTQKIRRSDISAAQFQAFNRHQGSARARDPACGLPSRSGPMVSFLRSGDKLR